MERRSAGDRITQIATGEAHTLALTGDGQVFSWGRGSLGRLGSGKEDDQSFPAAVKFGSSTKRGVSMDHGKEKLQFIAVAAGAYHSLALRDDGSIWSWGYNIYGQLGQGQENSLAPVLVERFLDLDISEGQTQSQEKNPLKICSVKAGGMMSCAIDNLGGLWMWGNCPQPNDVAGSESCLRMCPDPMPVWEFHGRTVVKVACGNEHVLALVSGAETFRGDELICFSWGNNKYGQLGLGDTENRARPQLVMMFNEESSWSVYEIACGAFHSAVLTQGKSTGDDIGSRCWTFGLGEHGQLGQGTCTNSFFPGPVSRLPKEAILISIDCGLFHTCVVSLTGDVWSWGMAKGLGLCPEVSTDDGDALYPLIIFSYEKDGPRFPTPVQIACGAAHTVIVADDGYKMWAWGRGRNGALGTGNTLDNFAPCISLWPPVAGLLKNKETRPGISHTRSLFRQNQTSAEVDRNLSLASEEVQALRSKLTLMERYATLLHVSVFGRPFEERNLPQSVRESESLDVRAELENAVESADDVELSRMETFYRNMLRNVKNTIMKRKIHEKVKECLLSERAKDTSA